MSISDVRLIAEDLALGTTTNTRCPWCNGGKRRQRSFSVTKESDGTILYNCYRASCLHAGKIGGDGSCQALVATKSRQRPYHGETYPLENDDYFYFLERFGLTKLEDLVMISGNDEYILPIFNRLNLVVGYNIRQPDWRGDPEPPREGNPSAPRANMYMHTEDEPISFYFPTKAHAQNPVVIVEDQISAIKCSKAGFKTVALCGTALNAARVREIAALKALEVVIAFDWDATDKAFRVARKWGLGFQSVRVAVLERDLKEELLDDIVEILS